MNSFHFGGYDACCVYSNVQSSFLQLRLSDHEAGRNLRVHVLLDHLVDATRLGLGCNLACNLLGQLKGGLDTLGNAVDHVVGKRILARETAGLKDHRAVHMGVQLVAEQSRHTGWQGCWEIDLILVKTKKRGVCSA